MTTEVVDGSTCSAKGLAFKTCFGRHARNLRTAYENFAYSTLETIDGVDLRRKAVLDVGTGEG